MSNFKEFDLTKEHVVLFKIHQDLADSDLIGISLSSNEDLWNGNRNKNTYKFCYKIFLGRDEWTKSQNYQGDDYIKYQKDFQDALDEYEIINKASEIKSFVGLYLIKLAMESI